MADNEIKIKVIVDDSQEKKYYSESESRRKKASNKENEEEKRKTSKSNEEEKRKTAFVKSELDAKYANLRAALEKERIAIQKGKELEVKEAIKARKLMEHELKLFEQANRDSIRRNYYEWKLSKDKEVRDATTYNQKFLKQQRAPEMGSVGFLSQITSEQRRFSPGSQDWKNLELIRQGTISDLKKAGVEVSSLSQKIGGQFKTALSEATTGLQNYGIGLVGVMGAQKLFNLSLESARFQVLRENFQGTTEDLEMFRKATSGTVDDGSLIRLSNQATDLGINLKDQAILFSLAEDASDKYGISVEEGFQKVVFATEGGTKGLKNIGIQKAVYEEIVKSLTEAYIREGKQIDAETEKQIKLQAVIQASGKSYEDVTNKVQDSADKHEQFLVVAKNLGLYYGGDFFNAVTGVGTAYKLLTEGVDLLSKGLEIQKGIIMSSVSAWQNLTSQIPIVGDAISWLADRYRDLAGAQSQTAEKTFVDAGADFIEAFDPNQTPTKTRSGSNANVLKKSGSKGSGFSKMVEETKQELNLVKLLEEELVKQNEKLQANLGDIGAERQIRADILEIEKQIYRYRTGIVNDNKFKMTSPVDQLREWNSRLQPKGFGVNPRALNDPRGDMSSEEIDKLLNGMEISFDDVRGYASQTSQFFESILSNAGLTDSAFGRILSAVNQVLNTGGSLFGMFDTFLSFIPGGSVAGGAIGAVAGGFNPMNSGMPTNNMRIINNQPIIIQGTLNGQKFLKRELPKYNKNKGAVTL